MLPPVAVKFSMWSSVENVCQTLLWLNRFGKMFNKISAFLRNFHGALPEHF